MVRSQPFYLAGEWRTSDERTTIRAPYDDRAIAEVHLASAADVDAAIGLAVTAFEQTRRLGSWERAEILRKVADGIQARRPDVEHTMVAESGKPLQQARQEIERAICTFTLAAEEAKRIGGELIPLDLMPAHAGKIGILRRVAIGPVVGIPAFNFPLNLVAHKMAPALAAGNPVLLKPAPQTPLTSLLLAEIFNTTGAPPGMLSVLPCANHVAERMVIDDRVRALTFTGSTAVGWRLKALAGKKRVLLELGGNAGAIIDADADLDHAAQRCAIGAFAYAGQVCVSLQRIFAHRDVYAAFVEKLVAMTGRLRVGDPADEATQVGPMIGDAAAERAEGLVRAATARGARVLAGGTRQGRLVAPTIVVDADPSLEICQEEAFAPIVTVSPFDTLDEAIRAVNRTRYGLQAAIFSNSLPHVMRAFSLIDAGSLIVNEAPLFRADNGPFGGVKDSGLGREAVRQTIETLTDTKLLVVNA